jgi:hypothetical protein
MTLSRYVLICLIAYALLACGCIAPPAGSLNQSSATPSITTSSPSTTADMTGSSAHSTFHYAYGSVADTTKDIRLGSNLPPIEDSIYFQDIRAREITFTPSVNITLKKGLSTGYMNKYFYDSAGTLIGSLSLQPEVILWVNRFSGVPMAAIPLPVEGDIPLTDVRDLSITIRYTNPDFPVGETANYELAYTAYIAWTEQE